MAAEKGSEEKKFSQIYPYKSLSKYEGLYGSMKCRAPTTYVGVEIELEKVKVISQIPSSFNMTEDGSLKVEGKEFITVPIRFCFLEQELNRLFQSIKKPMISSRCSIHVHLNARDFTQQELFRFVLLYLIFERSLFGASGGRDNNIFCTPLHSDLGYVIKQLKALCGNDGSIRYVEWRKYFALNLCPLWGEKDGSSKRLGTVEFRHMAGTTSTERIIDWVNLIVSLKLASKKMKTDALMEHIRMMNTTSAYNWLVHEVFQEWHTYLTTQRTFKEDVEAGIIAAKRVAFLQAPPVEIEIKLNKKGTK